MNWGVNTYGLIPDGIYYVTGGYANVLPWGLVLVALAAFGWLCWTIGRTGVGREFNRGYNRGFAAARAPDGVAARGAGYAEGHAAGYDLGRRGTP